MKNKNQFFRILPIFLFMLTVSACEKCLFKRTDTGLEYKITRKGAGPKPQEGEYMLFDMLYKTEKGDTIMNSADQEIPLVVQYADSLFQKNGGLEEAVSMLEKDDQAIFKINAKTIFGARFEELAQMHHLSDSSILLVHMHVKDVMGEEAFKTWQQKQLENMISKMQEETNKQLEEDTKIIDNYLTEHQITAQTTASGLRYVIDQPGHKGGKQPESGNTVKVNYVGKTLAGQIFDTSLEAVAKEHGLYNAQRKYEPLSFQVGKGQVIPGWDEGIMLLTQGSKARLFIPSPLAYGKYAVSETIKANTILMFEVELVDVVQ